jgi:hypothetical protein
MFFDSTFLMIASRKDFLDIIKYFIFKWVSINKTINVGYSTIIHDFSYHCQSIIDYLALQGEKIESQWSENVTIQINIKIVCEDICSIFDH